MNEKRGTSRICWASLLLVGVARADYEGISGRYNQIPSEDNVAGVDNFFAHSEPCTPDASSGLYGSDETGFSQYVSFYYQVETIPLLDATTVNKELLIPVEDSISRTILPELFAETCAPLAEARSGSRRFLAARGVSTRPADQVLEGVLCGGEAASEENECYVVDGNMTLFSDTPVDASTIDVIRTLIREAMNSGRYDNAHSQIAKVRYVSDVDTLLTSTEGDTTLSSGQESLPVFALVIISIGAAMILLAIFIMFGRWYKRRQDDASNLGAFPSENNRTNVFV